MQTFKLAILVCCTILIGSTLPVSGQDKSLKVTCVRNNQDGYDFNYEKYEEGTFVVIVRLNDPVNTSEHEYKQEVKSTSGLLFSVSPMIKNIPVSFSTYNTTYYRGRLNSKTDSTFVYALPYKKGNTFSVAYLSDLGKSFGNLSTKNFKSFEFTSKECDTICAIRKGVVVSVIDKYEMDTTLSKSYTSNVNSILVEHPDGTFASYTGFKKGAIAVAEGQTVFPYTPLGLLSYYDSRKTYSLRLMVYFWSETPSVHEEDQPVTLKTRKDYHEYVDPWFLSVKGVTKLQNHKSYAADFSRFILEQEMTKKELKAIGRQSREVNDLHKAVTRDEKDTIYMDTYDEEVPTRALASGYCILEHDPENSHRMIVKTYFLSGKLKSEGICTDKPDTYPVPQSNSGYTEKETGIRWLKHGNFKRWYENGQLQRDINFRNGTQSGTLVTYWDNGKVKRTNVDENGKPMPGKCFDRTGKEVPYYPYAKSAVFGDGKTMADEYVTSCIVYPEEAIDKAIEGDVSLQFSIQPDGTIGNFKTMKSADRLLEHELIRVVKSMPNWKPATLDGDYTAYSYSFTHRFTLPQPKINWALKLQNRDTTFYNNSGRMVQNRKYAGYYEILLPDPQHPDRVLERLYYASNKRLSEKYFMKSNLSENMPDSLIRKYIYVPLATGVANKFIRKPEGTFREWFENGNLKKEIDYRAGIKNGVFKMFWENGKPRRDDVFDNGVMVSGNCYDNTGNPVEYFEPDSKASYRSGKKAMIAFLGENLIYPDRPLKNKIEGTVEVKFVVEKSGLIMKIGAINRIDKDLDQEAVRLVKIMPPWLPEMKDGEPIESIQTLKIKFVL